MPRIRREPPGQQGHLVVPHGEGALEPDRPRRPPRDDGQREAAGDGGRPTARPDAQAVGARRTTATTTNSQPKAANATVMYAVRDVGAVQNPNQ